MIEMYEQEISTHFFKFAQTKGVTVRLREVKAKDFNYYRADNVEKIRRDTYEFVQYYYLNVNDENSSVVFIAEPINSFVMDRYMFRINIIENIKNLKKPITIDDMGEIDDKNNENHKTLDFDGVPQTIGESTIKKYNATVKVTDDKYEFAFTCKNKDLLNILKHYAKKSYVSICYYDKTTVEINGEKLQIIDNKFGAKFTDTSRLRTAYQDFCTYRNDYISHFVSNIPQSHILGITYFKYGLITIEDITAIKDGCTYKLIVAPIIVDDQLDDYHEEIDLLYKSGKIIPIGKSVPKTAEKPQQKEEVKEMIAKKTTKKTPAKKTSAKKTSGTTRTKGLHQTGTQTLAGKSMDAKIRAALPGKRTSASGKTYYEYRRNRTDMPTEREEFEKLFGKVKRAPKAEKKTAAKKTPTKKTSSGTSKKTAEAIKAELYSARSMLMRDKQGLRRFYELLHINEVEKAKWEKMGDKKRVQYNENLIKVNKANILKYETKVIPALEKEIAKLENEKKELEAKKTSGTPAKKKASSGTSSASKSSAKKKQVKSQKTRKTSKTQKTLF